MTDAATILLAIQTVLLLGLLVGLFVMTSRIRVSLDKANALMEEVKATVEDEVKPAVAEARRAIARAEEAASAATKALHTADPLLDTAGKVAGLFQRSTNGVWMDIAKVAFGLVGAIRGRGKKKTTSIEHEGDTN